MARVPLWLGIGGAALLAAGGLARLVIDSEPPAPAPEAGMSAGRAGEKHVTMPKAVATAANAAFLTIAARVGRTRSLAPAEDALTITVRPEGVREGESYLVNVYTVPKSEDGKPEDGKPDDGKPETASPAPEVSKADAFVGSFSFFPPPREGEVRTFTLPPPAASHDTGPDVTLKVEIVPAEPGTPLDSARLSIMDARIGGK